MMRRAAPGGAVLATLVLAVVAACAPTAPDAAARRLADREAVDATMQRYVQGLDHLDRDLYASSFAPDGVLDIDGNMRTGRNAMRAVVDQEIAFRKDMKDRGAVPRVLFHMDTNVYVTFPEVDRATRSAYWVTYIRVGKDPEGLSTLGVGTSVDELRRIGNEWLITHRRISLQP
jgi:uncharacterized protein (TIGR02246 family)